jgi:PAS domain S-box-containing protein
VNQPPNSASVTSEPLEPIRLPHGEGYRRLLESAPDALLVVDLHGRILFANRQTTSIFGYSASELAGQSIEILIPARLHEAHRAHRDGYAHAPVRRPMGIDMTLVAVRKDRTEFPVEVSLSPEHLDGSPVVCAAVRDVSWLQSARQAATRANYNAQIAMLGQQLISARELADIAAAAPAVIAAALGADASVLYMLDAAHNELQARGSFGIPGELLPNLSFATPPSNVPAAIIGSPDAVLVEDFDAEIRCAGPTTAGATEPKRGIGIAISSDDGPVGVLLARFRQERIFSEDDRNFLRSTANIVGSAIKTMRAEDQLRHAQQLEAVGQLTGGIAHDFNNLLTVIMGNLQIIEEDIAGNDAIAQPVDAAIRAASSAADLTRKLLAFSRRQALRPRPIDVNELVGGMLEMIRRALGERITILAYPAPSLPLAFADPAQLETALLNLVVNARDAMPSGGRLIIETGTRLLDADYVERAADVRANRYVMIAVSDNGMGMPADVVKRAFDPYFTTKERGKGSGLGLSMVHGFANQSSGHVAIQSEPGRGSTVNLFLPVAAEAESAQEPSRAHAAATGHEAILMVEDDDEVRRIGAHFLADLGYRVYQAGDADRALEMLAAHADIELLFTDIVLPGRYGGKELAAEVRRRRPDVALLFTSGYASEANQGIDNLPANLLDKPYRREALAAAVRAALDRC